MDLPARRLDMTPERQNAQPFLVMDKLDAELIRQQLAGERVEQLSLVFAVQDGGKLYFELNWQGVKEAVRVCAERGIARLAIGSAPPQLQETRDYCQFTVQAVDAISGQTNWGVAREYKRDNPFALQIALTKAQRNALRNLLPADIRRELIQEFAQIGRVDAVSLSPEPPQMITPKQLDRVRRDMESTGTDLGKFLTYYGIEGLQQLTREQASDAIGLLERKKGKEGRSSD
jgi:hypothetical protein